VSGSLLKPALGVYHSGVAGGAREAVGGMKGLLLSPLQVRFFIRLEQSIRLYDYWNVS
jgi:hypothetical protein